MGGRLVLRTSTRGEVGRASLLTLIASPREEVPPPRVMGLVGNGIMRLNIAIGIVNTTVNAMVQENYSQTLLKRISRER